MTERVAMAVFLEKLAAFCGDISRASVRPPPAAALIDDGGGLGQGELELDAARAAREGVPVSDAGWQELDRLAARYGVTPLGERLGIVSEARGEAIVGQAG